MKKLALLTLVVLTASATAGFQVRGRFSEAWASHTIKLKTEAGLSRLWFTVPGQSAIIVSAKGDSGESGPVRMTMNNSLDLKGAGTFVVTVTRDSGEGEWTCRDVGGNPLLQEFSGYVDVKHPARLGYDTEEDVSEWQFTYPKESTVLVRRIVGGKVVEDQDLYDDTRFRLYTAGSHLLELAATEGGGRFTAARVK